MTKRNTRDFVGVLIFNNFCLIKANHPRYVSLSLNSSNLIEFLKLEIDSICIAASTLTTARKPSSSFVINIARLGTSSTYLCTSLTCAFFHNSPHQWIIECTQQWARLVAWIPVSQHNAYVFPTSPRSYDSITQQFENSLSFRQLCTTHHHNKRVTDS